ncbi:hypothetical protein CH373_03675 [Leptospira perolatii]|uniref:Fluoride-specific ion channel FluC n=1 Tax=Leptospira perolatii TaxID=2023191 RepID=A0A2M9ZSR0_9LEPT|nr:fluoride efflux transporter CrcB [Leptospira perolatii]PJZ68767.1 hypothetical protein CH360_14555 [Leptospira perolatii]PJZ75122.1 hypothetical protein CH373_03675 [Leptospira perolatii]
MNAIYWIIPAGILGVLARYYTSLAVLRIWTLDFPFATFLVNIVGAFLIGIVFGTEGDKTILPAHLRAGITVGFLGGFTTFSTFCLEIVRLLESGNFLLAIGYFFLSNLFGVLFCLAGVALGRFLFF